MKATLMRGVRTAAMAPRFVLIGAIRLYQITLSPLLGPRCKYYPSCSNYGLEAVRTHGAMVGTVLAAWRVLRCNPFSNGGVDDVPLPGEKLLSFHRNNRRTFDALSQPSQPPSVTT